MPASWHRSVIPQTFSITSDGSVDPSKFTRHHSFKPFCLLYHVAPQRMMLIPQKIKKGDTTGHQQDHKWAHQEALPFIPASRLPNTSCITHLSPSYEQELSWTALFRLYDLLPIQIFLTWERWPPTDGDEEHSHPLFHCLGSWCCVSQQRAATLVEHCRYLFVL